MLLRVVRPLFRPVVSGRFRTFAEAAAAPSAPSLPMRLLGMSRRILTRRVALPMPLLLCGLYTTNEYMQDLLGNDNDFFNDFFVTDKDPEAIAEFYQAEDLLRIIAIHPIIFNLFMNQVVPDVEEATDKTALLSVGETHFAVKMIGMDVSFEIVEQEEQDEDGEDQLLSFSRHERFINWVPLLADFGIKILLWDQTWNYCFYKRPDGKYDVHHHGECWFGPWPIRLIVMLHQRYVLWGCEKFINSAAFGTDDIDRQQEQLACIPLHEFRAFVGILAEQKEHDLEEQMRHPVRDEEAIRSDRAALESLQILSESAESKISVVRRGGAKRRSSRGSRGAPQTGTKIVVGNQETQEALNRAMKDARGNTVVHTALKDLIQRDREWEERRPLERRKSTQNPSRSTSD